MALALSLSLEFRMISPANAPLLLALQAAAPQGGVSYLPLVVQFVLIIAIIYFIMVRPQQKQRQRHEQALSALKKGDEVVTAGGIVGEVIHIREATKGDKRSPMDDRITIKSGESRLVVERGRIARIAGTNVAPPEESSTSRTARTSAPS